MNNRTFLLALLGCLGVILEIKALPVTKTGTTKAPQNEQEAMEIQTHLEYNRYLEEVVKALEDDPTFRKKLDKASKADIENGNIAQELEYVDHHVRTQLDEIKRREVERLRALAKEQYERSNDIDRSHLKVDHSHLDHDNEHTFEIEDLRKLIRKTTEDLAKADQQRREEFKRYEMQKEYEHEMQKQKMNEEERKKFENELKEQEEKHKRHEKVHQPGNKAQLEEVWEKQDHMDGQNFDPHSFFTIHDVDGNGFWDETEVKALFIKELDKVYQSGLAEDDMRERAEEMERMREFVFQQTDTNHDGLISFDEFLEQTKRDEFQMDPEWNTLEKQQQYTHEEYLEFQRKREAEMQLQQQQYQQHQQQQQHHQQQYQQQQFQQPHGQQQQYQPPPQQQQYQQPPQQQYQQPPQQQYQQQYQQPPQQQQQYQPPQQQQQYQQPQQQYQQPPQQQQAQQPIQPQAQQPVQPQAQQPVQPQAQQPVQPQAQLPLQQQQPQQQQNVDTKQAHV